MNKELRKYLNILFGDYILYNRYSNELKSILLTGKELSDDNIYKILFKKCLMPYNDIRYGLSTDSELKSVYKIRFKKEANHE